MGGVRTEPALPIHRSFSSLREIHDADFDLPQTESGRPHADESQAPGTESASTPHWQEGGPLLRQLSRSRRDSSPLPIRMPPMGARTPGTRVRIGPRRLLGSSAAQHQQRHQRTNEIHRPHWAVTRDIWLGTSKVILGQVILVLFQDYRAPCPLRTRGPTTGGRRT